MAGLGPGHGVRRDRDGPVRRSLVDRVARSAAVGGGACILHPGGGPRWKAAAALHHAGRALAVARRPRTCRSAVSASAACLRGQALWRASRRRPARARPRLHATARSRAHHLRRLDHHACRSHACSNRAPSAASPRSCARWCVRSNSSVTLSKDEILALYLSLAPYGGNLEGVRAASLAYFGKEPRRLTLGEAAMLVALAAITGAAPPRPLGDAARNARDRVLDRLAAAGVVPWDEIARASTSRCRTAASRCRCWRRTRPTRRRRCAGSQPASPDHRRGAAEESRGACARARPCARTRYLGRHPCRRSCAAARCSRASPRRTISTPRRAGQVDMTAAVRSPGSTLKPFIYGLGFEDGLIHPDTLDRGPSRPLRQLCAGEFRSHLPGHGDGAPRLAAFTERARGGGARQDRRQPLCGAARAGGRIVRAARRAKCPGSRSGWAASG